MTMTVESEETPPKGVKLHPNSTPHSLWGLSICLLYLTPNAWKDARAYIILLINFALDFTQE